MIVVGKGYICSFCRRYYLKAAGCEVHERRCKYNKNGVHCSRCVHYGKKKIEGWNRNLGYCTLTGRLLGNTDNTRCSHYELKRKLPKALQLFNEEKRKKAQQKDVN